MRVEDGFQPTPFPEGNPYTDDLVLPNLLKRIFPQKVFEEEIDPDLVRFGNEVTTTLRHLSTLAEPPRLTQYDQWGQRVDTLHTSEGWRELKKFAQAEGIVGIPYERKYGELSRVYGFAKMMLMSADSQVILCPISMTDGCARVIELFGTPEMKLDIFPRLISRDPNFAFTAGQWMTERTGGSDVSQTETIAAPDDAAPGTHGASYKLDGFKWFSSATDSNIAVALARTGSPAAGSRSLSLFLIPLRLPLFPSPSNSSPSLSPSPTSNGVLVHRLKNKIGTQIVPTAELSLNGTLGYLLSPLNQGVKCITPVLNITRVYSALTSVGNLRRCLSIARSYATVRAIHSGTHLLRDVPIHVAELARVALMYRALTHLTFGAVRLLGRSECGVASLEENTRLRMLTPVVKAFAAEKACAAMEECMAALGGQGYMEENVIGRLIRDSLVEKIWEGTITVLALDLVKAARGNTAMPAFLKWAEEVISACTKDLAIALDRPINSLRDALLQLSAVYTSDAIPTLAPRPALFLFANVAAALYLLEHAVWSYAHELSESKIDVEAFRRWVEEGELESAKKNLEGAIAAQVSRQGADINLVYGFDLARPKL